MGFTKSDLYYKDYSWAADGGDNPHYKKYLDRIQVDKTEGYEVVYFCNDFLITYNKELTKDNFQRVERLLRDKDFSDVKLRSELNNQISKRWNLIVLKEIINKI